jgi:hypothetical protein
MKTYVLAGRTPVPEPDLLKWERWLETADRRVAQTLQGDLEVSTVFLGLDHSWWGKPQLFETMVFVNHKSQDTDRYASWTEAELGHEKMVRKVLSKNYQST